MGAVCFSEIMICTYHVTTLCNNRGGGGAVLCTLLLGQLLYFMECCNDDSSLQELYAVPAGKRFVVTNILRDQCVSSWAA